MTSNDYGNNNQSSSGEEDEVAVEEEKKQGGSRLRQLTNSQGKAAYNSFVQGDDEIVEKNFNFNKQSIEHKQVKQALNRGGGGGASGVVGVTRNVEAGAIDDPRIQN